MSRGPLRAAVKYFVSPLKPKLPEQLQPSPTWQQRSESAAPRYAAKSKYYDAPVIPSALADGDERKVNTPSCIAETVRRYLHEIPERYPKQEETRMRKRIYVFTLSLMTFLAVASPALANGNWGG